MYCTRREETVRVAALLRTCLQGVLVKENKHINSSQEQTNPAGQRKKDLGEVKTFAFLVCENVLVNFSGSQKTNA